MPSSTVNKAYRAVLRRAVADLMHHRGCGCCAKWEDASARLAQLLHVPKYKDGSGYDFARYRTPAARPREEESA